MQAGPPIRILVPIDFLRESAEALERAVALCAVFPVAEVCAVHVVTVTPEVQARAQLERVRAMLAATDTVMGQRTTFRAESRSADTIVEGILAAAAELQATLIVVGTRGGPLMGAGIAERVVHRAKVDVLVVSHESAEQWPAAPAQILVPVDLSDNAHRALQAARYWAGANPIAMLHVVDPSTTPNGPGNPSERSTRLRARIARWAGAGDDEIAIVAGDPSCVVADRVCEGDVGLVVVGATGTRDLEAFVRGGMPERLIQTARAPVLVVQ